MLLELLPGAGAGCVLLLTRINVVLLLLLLLLLLSIPLVIQPAPTRCRSMFLASSPALPHPPSGFVNRSSPFPPLADRASGRRRFA